MRFIYICIFLAFSIVDAARILVVLPTPAYSHNVMYKTIYRELSLRGHQIVAFTPNPLKEPHIKNLIEVDLSYLYKYQVRVPHRKLLSYFQLGPLEIVWNTMKESAREVLTHPDMQRLVNDTAQHFDLLLLEWDVDPSLTVLSRRFDCPMIGLSSKQPQVIGHETVGNPTNPSYIPSGWGDFEMDFMGRTRNLLMGLIYRAYYYWYIVPEAQKLSDRIFPEHTIDVVEVQKNVSMIIANTHPVITGVRPVVPAYVEVGGVHLGRNLKLIPEDVRSYLDSSTSGVVYVNLGSAVGAVEIDPDWLKTFISALSELPYRVLWKWYKTSVTQLPLNVKTVRWLPQETILGHPNIKLFITNGGLQSLYEAINNTVPLLGIPFFADQFVNVRQMEKLRIGKRINFSSFKKSRFIAYVKRLAENPMYKKNIKYARELLHDLPMRPMEKAVWWIEYVLRHKGARHMRSPAVDMDLITYFLLDVIAFVVLCVMAVCMAIWYAWKFIKSTLGARKRKEKVQ